MGPEINILILNVSPALSMALVTLVFLRLRKNPSFTPLFDFKRPLWIAVAVSVGIVLLGFSGMTLCPIAFRFLGFPHEALGADDLAILGFLLLMFCGGVILLVCFIVWLRNIMTAIHSCLQLRWKSKTNDKV